MDDDAGPSRRFPIRFTLVAIIAACAALVLSLPAQAAADPRRDLFLFSFVLVLLSLSAFFSGSEVAFFSLHKVRLKAMAGGKGITAPLVGAMMEHPSRLLTTILIGNMIVNVLLSVIMPRRIEAIIEPHVATWFGGAAGVSQAASYAITIVICTAILVFFGEITPKVFAVRAAEFYARIAVLPLRAADTVLGPLRWAVMRFTELVFRVTRFDDVKASPFITDDEFKGVLADGNVRGVIEEEDRQMIEGVLEFSDAQLREILTPRPDVVALSEDTTLSEVLAVFKEREYSRMPVYKDDIDHITGVLFAKDLLPAIFNRSLDRPVSEIARVPHFVPITMTAHDFVKDAQRMRMHLAIVVDEYGGTEGIVTLEDAIEEVVGDIRDQEQPEGPHIENLGKGRYRVDGNLPLDELSDLIGIAVEDAEHETVAGFFMDRTNRVPAMGDRIEHNGTAFTVEEVDGKRAATVYIEVTPEPTPPKESVS